MKFYKTNISDLFMSIRASKKTACIYRKYKDKYNFVEDIAYFKNGVLHNCKRHAINALNNSNSTSSYYYNDIIFSFDSNKEWRKYCKLLVFT